MKKTPEEIVAILDELSEDANQWPSESNDRRKSVGVHQVDFSTAVQAQLDVMSKEIRNLTLVKVQSQPSPICDFCGMGHPMHECQAVAVDEVGQGAPGFQNQQRQQYQPPQSNQSSMKELMKAFIIKTNERLETHISVIQEHGAAIKELGMTFRNLERQNPIAKKKEEPIERQREIVDLQKNNNIQEGEVMVDQDFKKKGKIRAQKKKKDDNSTNNETKESKYTPALPFPQKQRREKLYKQFKHFLEVFKKVHMNIPFTEVLSQMPAYAKFMKEILSKKRKVEETSVVKLKEHCSAILQNKLPQKYGDQGVSLYLAL
uniref:Retrotransposon gag protein n=1 Tax=Nicotiana tabacum TaxID=4097 RepID=A0A1S4ATC1_TOBAC|nr:PREDICTED: uncharacterized protein LOC107801061 [Nicotiana tabacum]